MKIVCKEDINTVKEFQKHHFMTYSKPALIVFVCSIILGVLLLTTGDYKMGLFALLFAFIFVIFYPITFYVTNKKLNKSNKSLNIEKTLETEFLDNEFCSKFYEKDKLVNQCVYKYNEIHKVDESNTHFYLYVSINQAICISKNDINDAEINELRNILENKCNYYKKTKF